MDQSPAGEPATTSGPGRSGPTTVRCDQCGETVPALTVCVRCGDPLGSELRKGRSGRVREGFAAAPEERATALRVISTLYPALPREEIRTFQAALLGGTALVVVLGILGFFPVAIVAAAILVPLLTVLYLYDVDVYEDEPIRVIALTFLWGLVTGGLFAWALDALFPIQAANAIGGSITGAVGGSGFPVLRGVLVPIVAGVIMTLGPAAIMRSPRFNDVLDGATFGVASAVAFTGAQTLVTSIGLFDSGLRPVGDVVPWVVRLLALGVAMPLVSGGAIGGLVGVLWLRYRAPVRDRAALGPFSQPPVAGILAGALMVLAALAELLLSELAALAVLVVLAVIAMLWLRRVIHLGLLQESREMPIGDPVTCPNCGKQTPLHSFCGECGVSMRALPKAGRAAGGWGGIRAPHRVAPEIPATGPGGRAVAEAALAMGRVSPPRDRPWLSQRGFIALFVVVLVGAVVVAAAIAYALSQGRDQPACEDHTLPCAARSSVSGALAREVMTLGSVALDADGPPFPELAIHEDTALGFSLRYDADLWTVEQEGDGFALLTIGGGVVALIIEGAPASVFDDETILEARRGLTEGQLLGFARDTVPAHVLPGTPILGHRPGVAGLFGGAIDSPQGPSVDLAVAFVAASDGEISVVATLLVPVELREAGLSFADSVINTFTWPTDPVVE